MPYIARCSQPRACETSKPTRSVSLALAKSFGNAGVMGGMLGVAMAEVILHGAQIATSFTAPCSAHPVARYAKLNFNLVG